MSVAGSDCATSLGNGSSNFKVKLAAFINRKWRISPLNIWFPVMWMIAVNGGEMNRGRSGNRPAQASVLGAVTSTLNRDVGMVVDCRRRMAVLSIGCAESNCYCAHRL
jgi:hypothetical protein